MTDKITAPAMVYIQGEEMTRYVMELILDQWINPYFDTSAWEYYDLSVKSRDVTNDKILADAVDAGKRIGAIFKEPTITPTKDQKESMGLKNTLGSPNGAMRRGWNGITISRDTITIPGLELGYKRPVLFERQAVGGEYGAAFGRVGKGKITTTFTPDDGGAPVTVSEKTLDNDDSMVVTYHNPLDNTHELAHIFFTRCLENNVTPYVTTKKTVFKWQEPFWETMKAVFDKDYKNDFLAAGLLDNCGGELTHLISDAATMKLVAWTDGGFGMAAHNYDGDVLTDLVSQVHRSPGFIRSSLVGRTDDGTLIREFEASHGTVSDMDQQRKAGQETSLNPLGMVDALIGAMDHSATLAGGAIHAEITEFTAKLRNALYTVMTDGRGTRDLEGKTGSTTEQFITPVAGEL